MNLQWLTRRNRFKKPAPLKRTPWQWPGIVRNWRVYARRVAVVCLSVGGLAGLTWALDRPIRVTAHAFSASAAAAITTAGGSVDKMPLPFGNGRPPASGNALMNR